MSTQRLSIKEVTRGHPIWIVQPTDFVSEPCGTIEPEEVVRDPKFGVYCLDLANDAVLFVESDDPEAVDRAPFYYQAQVQHAKGLVSMPLPVFHDLAKVIPEPAQGLIFIHSVGRCGSTLVSKALQAVPSVKSLSEPDEFTQMVMLRGAGRLTDDELSKVLLSSARWRCKPRIGPAPESVAIKTRSEVLVLWDLIGTLFGHSRHCFLYRDGVSWMGSNFKGWPADREIYDPERNKAMIESWGRTLPLAREYLSLGDPLNAVEIRMLAWITSMEAYLKLVELGLPICAARFEDLAADPMRTIEKLLIYLKIDDVDWDSVREVASRDSQAGTIYDREDRRKLSRELTHELVQDIQALVATRPLLLAPDTVLPGTL